MCSPVLNERLASNHQIGICQPLAQFLPMWCPSCQITAPSASLHHDFYLISVEPPYSLGITALCAKVGKLSPAENDCDHLMGFPFPQCL